MKLAILACAATALAQTPVAHSPVVVELFTSEGCSSCPSADALLSSIAKSSPGVEVIALSEHVDYWNQLGWRDPFSSAQFTERQQNYARRFGIRGPYTPQMVVDGRWEFVGSDRERLARALREAAGNPKPRVAMRLDGDSLAIALPDGVMGEAWLAITEDGLTSDVRRGENGGRTLRHDAVVRRLVKLGGGKELRYAWKPDASWKSPRAVVFVTGDDGRVLAAGSLGAL